MRVLHLVLYSPTSPVYNFMVNWTKPWYARFNDIVDTYYYYCDPTISTPEKTDCFLRLPGKETYIPGILDKTLQAFRYFFSNVGKEDEGEQQQITYDFIVRSNISSVVNFKVLLPILLSKQKDSFLYGGPHIMTSTSLNDGKVMLKEDLHFVQGTCIILRPDAIKTLLLNDTQLNRDIEDDASIGLFFQNMLQMRDACSSWFKAESIGLQFAGFQEHFNLDVVSVFRNHHFESDRLLDLEHVQKEVLTLTKRYFHFPKPENQSSSMMVLESVFYHNKNITQPLHAHCLTQKDNTWFTNCDNAVLDALFGDPAPNVFKKLYLTLADGLEFAHPANLTFMVDPISKKLIWKS